jgi:NDP-sugar pyrophosphorylase family protein
VNANSKLTTAMVLTAGLGTRLRPLTFFRAKPAIPVAGQTMVQRIVRWLSAHGVEDIVLNLHHLPQTIAAAAGDGSDLSVRVRYSWEQPVLLGPAGGPRRALDIIGAPTFLLVNGDTLTDVNLAALVQAHRDRGAQVTLALIENREPHRYGGVRLDRDGKVTGFSRAISHERSFHFVGVQVVDSKVFRPLAPDKPAASIGGLYDQLIAQDPGAVHGFVSDASFWDMGTPADYWSMSWAFHAAENSDEAGLGSRVIRGARVAVDATARLSRTILWDDVTVERGAMLEQCIVIDGVRVPSGLSYERSILMPGADLNAPPRAVPLPL